MTSVNKVIILGNVTNEVSVKYLPNGEAVANFSIATNETWKAKDGTKQSKAEYHNIVCYRRLAEIAGEYLKKGSQAYFEGKLQTRKWEKDGVTRYSTEIIADTMKMLGGRSENNSQDDTSSRPAKNNAPQEHTNSDPSDFSDFDDDIPFMNPYKFNWRAL